MQIPLEPSSLADDPAADERRGDDTRQIAPDLSYRKLDIVNVVFYGAPGAADGGWVLIDAGIPGSFSRIVEAAEKRFGPNSRPAAIILTHGHFDHVGALENLAERWQSPIYAHGPEWPYLNGHAAYPPPDPRVGGGMMAWISPLYPTSPVNVSRWLRPLPADGSLPGMPGWRWLQTPGHTPGHIALWRDADRALIAGDAFITTRQESAYAVITEAPEMHGPPMYLTPDWESARESVRRLASLQPELVVTGHGPAVRGSKMLDALNLLATDFDRIAVPKSGKYVLHPATPESGAAYREPR
jgi:glyoxylase-like metal-dependent hydrolase (beta-lactamase superfamily II)